MAEDEPIDWGDKYEWVKDLGEGASGVAVLMRDKGSGELLAVKYIPRGDKVDKNVVRELLNHQKLSGHVNIVQFREVFLTSTHLAIAMEYCGGGTLYSRVEKLERFREDIARYFFQQLVCGLVWCHNKDVSHRDIKLENTLLDGKAAPRLKICDFGYSKDSDIDSTPNTMVGTPAYIAPEVCSGEEYAGEPADVWSCGVSLYTMLVGAYPFSDPDHPSSVNRMIQRIIRVQYEVPDDVTLSDACLDLLRRIFVKDPAQRITLAQIRQHPWYLVNLPSECQNDGLLLRRDPPSQTEEQILAVVQEAQRAEWGAARRAEADWGPAAYFNEEENLPDDLEGRYSAADW